MYNYKQLTVKQFSHVHDVLVLFVFNSLYNSYTNDFKPVMRG